MTKPLFLRRAFTLVEMIAVMAVIGIVAVFVVPAVSGMLGGSQLTQASSMLVDQVSLARQQALTKNIIVEVRFIQFADPEQPGENVSDPTTGKFRAIQLMEALPSGIAVPLPGSKLQMLPPGVMMESSSPGSGGPIYSTLLAQANGGAQYTPSSNLLPADPELPRGIKRNYNYFSFRFRSDGSTDLAPIPPAVLGNWYGVTLHGINDSAKLRNGLQAINFFTLQLDPVSGATKVYHPTAQ